MLYQTQKVVKITAAGTQNVLDNTGYLLALILSVATPGTLAITIQDKATTPNKLLPAIDLTLGTDSDAIVKDWKAPQPVRMDGGIDIVTTGTGGEVYFWIFYLFEPEVP